MACCCDTDLCVQVLLCDALCVRSGGCNAAGGVVHPRRAVLLLVECDSDVDACTGLQLTVDTIPPTGIKQDSLPANVRKCEESCD